MHLRPVGHRVLIKLDKVEETSAGGIILNVDQRDQAGVEEGKVIEIGPDAFLDFGRGNAWCEVGDKVKLKKFAGVNHKDENTGDIFRIINDEDIYAIVVE